MKNAVIALLMAKSANAQKGKKAGMEADYTVPAPALIAAEWNDYKCTDKTVAAAQTALTGLEGALKSLVTAKTPLDAAVTKAVTAKTAAVKAVVDKDAAAKVDIAADDAEDLKELTLRRAMNDASYALAVAKTAKTAADGAKAAKDSEKAAADKVKAAMDTAKTAADTHLGLEKAETIKLKTAYDAAKKAYLGANGLGDTDGSKKTEATAKGLYDAALKVTGTKETAATAGKKDWDAKKATTDAAKVIYDAAVTAKG